MEISTEMEKGSVVIRCGKDMERNLMIHLPFWGRDARVFRNQMEQKVKQHQGYVQLSPCRKGEEIRLELPVRLRLVTNEENDHLVNLACGPYLLAAISDQPGIPGASAFGSVPAGWAAISLYGKGTEIRSLPGGRPGTGTLIF